VAGRARWQGKGYPATADQEDLRWRRDE
jgi:hypothetical protein